MISPVDRALIDEALAGGRIRRIPLGERGLATKSTPSPGACRVRPEGVGSGRHVARFATLDEIDGERS